MSQKPHEIDNLELFDEVLAPIPEVVRPVGRPKEYSSNAERQKAYRERLKAQGKRVITKVVVDVREGQDLRSDIIDLSEIRK